VRGVANVDLTPELVVALGRAAARVLGPGPFLIGRDTRVSGPLLRAALTAGITAEGDDIVDLGLRERQVVNLTSHFRGETRSARRFVVVPYDIPRGCACTYFPEANALVPARQVAHTSNTPASKSVVISVTPARDARPFDPERTP